MVFQSYALYPHMSVFDNMSFALRLAGIDKATIREKVERAAQILNLGPYLQRTPRELSGGQRQRVAIGRAIVRAPKVFLFDEPLSNLDAALRGQTRVEIANLHRELGATTIHVTHDQVEAMTLADRVVVLRDGALPAFSDLTGGRLPGDGSLGVRPEGVRVVTPDKGAVKATVSLIEALGSDTPIYVDAGGVSLVARQSERTSLHRGDQVGIDLDTAELHLFNRDGRVASA
jgi:multiple sugar transport system ATP-binding protein